MKHVRLPSGLVLNLAAIDTLAVPPGSTQVKLVFSGSSDVVVLDGEDAVMLRTWAEKRPLLIPPARGAKK